MAVQEYKHELHPHVQKDEKQALFERATMLIESAKEVIKRSTKLVEESEELIDECRKKSHLP